MRSEDDLSLAGLSRDERDVDGALVFDRHVDDTGLSVLG